MIQVDDSWAEYGHKVRKGVWGEGGGFAVLLMLTHVPQDPWCLVMVGDMSEVDQTCDRTKVTVTVYKQTGRKDRYGGVWKPWQEKGKVILEKHPLGAIEMSGLSLTGAGRLAKASLQRVRAAKGSSGPQKRADSEGSEGEEWEDE